MKSITIRPIVEGKEEGQAIVSQLPISFYGDVDPETGKILDKSNPLYGKSIANKIFIFPESRGSTVGSYVIYGLQVNGVAPLGFIVNTAETIVIAGAILADIPLVDKPESDIFSEIKTGDIVQINTIKKEIVIEKRMSID